MSKRDEANAKREELRQALEQIVGKPITFIDCEVSNGE